MNVLRFPVRALLLIVLLTSSAAVVSGQTAGNRLIITQIYGAGGGSGSVYNNDWVELYNNTSSDINLSGLSLQYTSPVNSGTWANLVALSGIVKAKHFFLVQLTYTAGLATTSLPTPDLIGTTNLAATYGKVAVATGTTKLSGACPAGFITFLGYGGTGSASSSNCSESGVDGSNIVQLTTGTPSATNAGAPGTTNTIARIFSSGVFSDTGKNSSDFASMAVAPRNSSLGYAVVVNGTGTVNKYDGTGTFTPGALVFGPKGTAGTATTIGGVAMDHNGGAWSVTSTGSGVNLESADGSASTNYAGGGISAPAAVAVDGVGNVWVANSNTNSVSELTNAGAAVSADPDTSGTPAAYANGGFSGEAGSNASSVYNAPHGVAVDSAGNVWVSNSSANTIVQIVGAAAPVAPLSTAVLNSSTGARP